MCEKRYCCEKHPTRPTTKSQRNNSNISWTSLSLKCNQHVRHRWCPRPCILSFVQHNDVAQLLLQTPLRNGTNPRGPTRNGNKNIGHRWCPRLSVQLSFVQHNAAAQLLLQVSDAQQSFLPSHSLTSQNISCLLLGVPSECIQSPKISQKKDHAVHFHHASIFEWGLFLSLCSTLQKRVVCAKRRRHMIHLYQNR